ncbi:protein-tyrosine-phosphatase, partial [Trachipleistophora hominis]
VLSTMTILKNDYFRGFSLFESMYRIDGIFNMRYIRVLDHLIVGCAMPKANAIKKLLLKVLKEHQKKNAAIHWFCMREEPVIYVNNTPYVLRRYSVPYDNIEITGIDSNIVHKMEVQLKKDIYDEIKDNLLLVHDETLVKGTCVITHKWVEVEAVKTMREVYNIKSLIFHRVPISDERAPMPRLISYLYDTLCKVKGEMVLFFNCQMGRGRTTTFMILSYMTLIRNSLDTLPWETIEYRKPRFILIQQLLKFLPNARSSKKFADFAIDNFDHIENIRDIIEELAKSSVTKNIEKAQAFLLRYMYVICFAEFILGKETSFTDFLLNRPEIQELVASNLNTDLKFI